MADANAGVGRNGVAVFHVGPLSVCHLCVNNPSSNDFFLDVSVCHHKIIVGIEFLKVILLVTPAAPHHAHHGQQRK